MHRVFRFVLFVFFFNTMCSALNDGVSSSTVTSSSVFRIKIHRCLGVRACQGVKRSVSFSLAFANQEPAPCFVTVATVSRRLSAELEARGRLYGIEQLALHQLLVVELGQLEQVHAGAGGGKALQIVPSVMDAEGGVELLKKNRGRSTGELIRHMSVEMMELNCSTVSLC